MSDWKLKRGPNSIVALERLYLKSDMKTICREGDPEAAALLAAVGSDIPAKLARRIGLFDEPKKEEPKTLSTESIEHRSTRPAEPKAKR